MLIPLRQNELDKLIPSVATSNQFTSALGNPRKILQRIIISSIGGVVTLLISQSQVTSQFYSMWLILGVVFLLYLLWGPILEASRKNAKLKKYSFAAIFEAEIIDIYTHERVEDSQEQANKMGQLELVENRRRWLVLEIGDEDGYLSRIEFPLENKHQQISQGSLIRGLIFSNNKDFSNILNMSDAWLPRKRLWVGEYPFLLKPAFEELCSLRINR